MDPRDAADPTLEEDVVVIESVRSSPSRSRRASKVISYNEAALVQAQMAKAHVPVKEKPSSEKSHAKFYQPETKLERFLWTDVPEGTLDFPAHQFDNPISCAVTCPQVIAEILSFLRVFHAQLELKDIAAHVIYTCPFLSLIR